MAVLQGWFTVSFHPFWLLHSISMFKTASFSCIRNLIHTYLGLCFLCAVTEDLKSALKSPMSLISLVPWYLLCSLQKAIIHSFHQLKEGGSKLIFSSVTAVSSWEPPVTSPTGRGPCQLTLPHVLGATGGNSAQKNCRLHVNEAHWISLN